MARRLYANNASSTIVNAGGINGTDTSITLYAGDGAKFPALSGGDWFMATISQAGTETSWEIVKVTGRSTDTLTISNRAQEGTSAQAWAAGSTITVRETKDSLTDGSNEFIGDSGSGGTRGLVPAPASGDAAASKVLGAGGTWVNRYIRTPYRFYWLVPNTSDKQPVMYIERASTLKNIRWFRDDATTVSGTTVLLLKKNGTTLYTLTLASGASTRTWSTDWNGTSRAGLSDALAAGDYIEMTVSTGNTTVKNFLVQLDIEQAIY